VDTSCIRALLFRRRMEIRAYEALVIYKDTGSSATSPLIAYIDTGTNLPASPNGGDITIQYNASGILPL
jgi:hypothetical protein